ncbi:MAG: hypothetical protein ACYDBB_10975 [Armatimonadota bacterium]
MQHITRRFALTVIMAAVPVMLAGSLLLAAPKKYISLVFEAEQVQKLSGITFKAIPKKVDPSGEISGKMVLAIPKLKAEEKLKADEVTYRVRVPQDDTYYFWARTHWSTGCGNSFFLKVQGYGANKWVLGGDGTYDTLHWICLSDGDNGGQPRPLILKKGVVTITLATREGGVEADQFILTNDKEKRPAGIFKPTPNLLVIEKPAPPKNTKK